MYKADAHCTLGKEGRGSNRKNFMFKFSCPALKYKFYFIMPWSDLPANIFVYLIHL